MERIQKIISNSGYCSRRKAEELIQKGLVTVNGNVITQMGYKVGNKDKILVEGNIITNEEKVYYILNKPRGCITTTKDDKNRKTVVDLIPEVKRIYPVGRLDYDTTGVLLLTNDGILANELMHPSSNIEKVYIAKVKGLVTGNAINKLKNGVEIEGKKTSPAKVKLKSVDKKTGNSIVQLIIHEGKNHQVKKMFEAVGYEVLKLKRERYAFLDTYGVASGEYRKLLPKEVAILYALINTKKR